MTTITHKRKLRNLEETLADLEILQQYFPKAFPPKGKAVVKPLQVNIVPILEEALKKHGCALGTSRIKRALGFWCSRKFYLKAVIREQHRVNLNGHSVEDVTEAEKASAQTKVESINLQRLLTETPVLQAATQ
jgi:sRNA-binding protein